MPREKSCGAIIFRRAGRKEYLLLHYGAGHWDFAKGHMEAREEETQTVVREVKEETGLEQIAFINEFREMISYYYRRKARTVFKEVVFFLVEASGGTVKISGEHIGYEWLPFQNAYDRLTFKNAKEILRKAEGYLQRLDSKS